MDYKKYILKILIDKYNNSNHFKEISKNNRKVIMYFDEKDFPEYDIENSDLKGEIHYIVENLKEKGIIEYEWLKGQKGNIIRKAYLNLNHLNEAHIEAGIKLKRNILDELLNNIIDLRQNISIDWINNFLNYTEEEIIMKKKYPNYIPKNERDQMLLFKAFKGIQDKGSEELLFLPELNVLELLKLRDRLQVC